MIALWFPTFRLVLNHSLSVRLLVTLILLFGWISINSAYNYNFLKCDSNRSLKWWTGPDEASVVSNGAGYTLVLRFFLYYIFGANDHQTRHMHFGTCCGSELYDSRICRFFYIEVVVTRGTPAFGSISVERMHARRFVYRRSKFIRRVWMFNVIWPTFAYGPGALGFIIE